MQMRGFHGCVLAGSTSGSGWPHGHGAVKVFLYPRVLEALDASMPSLMSTFWFARPRHGRIWCTAYRGRGYQKHREAQCIAQGQNHWSKEPRLDPVLRWVRQETGCSHQAPRLSPVLRFTMPPDNEAGYLSPARQATPPSPACLPNARQEAAPDRHARSKEERRSPRRSAMNTTRPSGTECRTFAPYARASYSRAVGRAPDTDHARMRLLQPDDATQEHHFPVPDPPTTPRFPSRRTSRSRS